MSSGVVFEAMCLTLEPALICIMLPGWPLVREGLLGLWAQLAMHKCCTGLWNACAFPFISCRVKCMVEREKLFLHSDTESQRDWIVYPSMVTAHIAMGRDGRLQAQDIHRSCGKLSTVPDWSWCCCTSGISWAVWANSDTLFFQSRHCASPCLGTQNTRRTLWIWSACHNPICEVLVAQDPCCLSSLCFIWGEHLCSALCSLPNLSHYEPRSDEANWPRTKPWASVSHKTSLLLLGCLPQFFFTLLFIITMESWPTQAFCWKPVFFFPENAFP